MVLTVALCLFGAIDPSQHAGALTSDEQLANTPVEQMTQEQLKAEADRLDKQRASFVGPVVMAGVGGLVLIIGGVFFIYGVGLSLLINVPTMMSMTTTMVLTGLQIAGYVLMGIGGVMVVVGGIFLAVGLARLFPTLARRREAMERRDEVLKRLEGVSPQDTAPSTTPPPPPPPADAWLFTPRPTLVLAEF